jgi:hypothetical protein
MIVCLGMLPLILTYNIKISAKNGKLEFRADIFNLLNAENLSGYSNNAKSNQIQGGSVASGLFTKECVSTKTISIWC